MKKSKKIIIVIIGLSCLIILFYLLYRFISMAVADYLIKDLIKSELQELYQSGKIKTEDLIRSDSRDQSGNNDKSSEGNAATDPNDKTEPNAASDTRDSSNNAQPSAGNPVGGGTEKNHNADSAGTANQPDVQKAIDKMADEIANQISDSEKQEIMNLVFSKLSADDIAYLAGLLEGGLTKEEKSSAKQLAYSRFTADEIRRIKEYYNKYNDLTG